MKLLGKAEQYRLTTLIELPNLVDVDFYRDNRTSFGACTVCFQIIHYLETMHD